MADDRHHSGLVCSKMDDVCFHRTVLLIRSGFVYVCVCSKKECFTVKYLIISFRSYKRSEA